MKLRRTHFSVRTMDRSGREHLNPVQFACNPWGNLWGLRLRDFGTLGDWWNRPAVLVRNKLARSQGSQAAHRARRCAEVAP